MYPCSTPKLNIVLKCALAGYTRDCVSGIYAY